MDNIQYPSSDGVIDMEVNCITCHERLHIPDASIDAVLTSLNRMGAVVLVCTCGQMQIVEWNAPQMRKRVLHD